MLVMLLATTIAIIGNAMTMMTITTVVIQHANGGDRAGEDFDDDSRYYDILIVASKNKNAGKHQPRPPNRPQPNATETSPEKCIMRASRAYTKDLTPVTSRDDSALAFRRSARRRFFPPFLPFRL